MLPPEEGDFCKCLLINFDPADVGFGETLIYNTTQKHIKGVFGKKQVSIAPRERLKLKDSESGSSESFVVQLKVGDGKVYRPLSRNLWVKNPNMRRIGFVVTDSISKRARVLCFPEHRKAGGK